MGMEVATGNGNGSSDVGGISEGSESGSDSSTTLGSAALGLRC